MNAGHPKRPCVQPGLLAVAPGDPCPVIFTPKSPSESMPPGRNRRMIALTAFTVIGAAILLAGWAALRARPDPDRLWGEAETAFLAGRWDRARASLVRLARLRQPTPLDRLLEAQLATAEERPDEALAAIGSIPESHPIAPQALLLSGRIERQRDRIAAAELAFRRALTLKPGLIEAHRELIYILGIQSRRSEVDAEFRALAGLTTLTHHDLFTWALTHFSRWSPDVVSDLEGFIAADPGDRQSRLALASMLIGRPGTEDQIRNILAPIPLGDPDALALRIQAAFERGQVAEATGLLAEAPEDNPRIERIRGELAMRHRDLDAAIRHFRRAITAEPYDRVAPAQLARALRLRGDTDAAAALEEQSRRLNRLYNLIFAIRSPGRANRPSDLVDLGLACENAGLIDEARGWYDLAITASPLDVEAQQGLHRLGPSRRPAVRAGLARR